MLQGMWWPFPPNIYFWNTQCGNSEAKTNHSTVSDQNRHSGQSGTSQCIPANQRQIETESTIADDVIHYKSANTQFLEGLVKIEKQGQQRPLVEGRPHNLTHSVWQEADVSICSICWAPLLLHRHASCTYIFLLLITLGISSSSEMKIKYLIAWRPDRSLCQYPPQAGCTVDRSPAQTHSHLRQIKSRQSE